MILGQQVTVEPGAVIVGPSILCDDSVVRRDAVVDRSIVGVGASVEAGRVLRNRFVAGPGQCREGGGPRGRPVRRTSPGTRVRRSGERVSNLAETVLRGVHQEGRGCVGRRDGADPLRPGDAGDCPGDSHEFSGAGVLSAQASGVSRRAVRLHQVPYDEAGRPYDSGETAIRLRGGRSPVQNHGRSSHHGRGAVPPGDLSGRDPAVLQRAVRADERGGAPAVPGI